MKNLFLFLDKVIVDKSLKKDLQAIDKLIEYCPKESLKILYSQFGPGQILYSLDIEPEIEGPEVQTNENKRNDIGPSIC